MSRKNTKHVLPFGKNLAIFRKGLHLTQPELAEKLAMTREMISYLETRATNPTLEQIQRFADFFEVSTDELIYDLPQKTGHSGPASKLEGQIEKLRKLPKTTQKIVSEMIEGVVK